MFLMIGSTLKENEALETLKQECGEFNFPQKITVKNHMPRDVVGAQVNLFLDSNLKTNGITVREVEFPTFGHLMQFVTDIELVAKMNGFERAVSLSSNVETSEANKDSSEDKSQKTRSRKPKLQEGGTNTTSENKE